MYAIRCQNQIIINHVGGVLKIVHIICKGSTHYLPICWHSGLQPDWRFLRPKSQNLSQFFNEIISRVKFIFSGYYEYFLRYSHK